MSRTTKEADHNSLHDLADDHLEVNMTRTSTIRGTLHRTELNFQNWRYEATALIENLADTSPGQKAQSEFFANSYSPNLFQSSFLIRRAPKSRALSSAKRQPTTATIVQVPAHLLSLTQTKAARAKPNTAIQDRK